MNKCNCDLKEWDGVDSGVITGTHNLPVQQLLFGDSDGPYRKQFKIMIRQECCSYAPYCMDNTFEILISWVDYELSDLRCLVRETFILLNVLQWIKSTEYCLLALLFHGFQG